MKLVTAFVLYSFSLLDLADECKLVSYRCIQHVTCSLLFCRKFSSSLQ